MERAKKMFKIFIEGKKGFLKKLEPETPISKLRELLKDEITDSYYFVGEDNLEIKKEDEKDFNINEIIVEGNHIYIKNRINYNKIMIFQNESKIEEIEISNEKNFDELRKLLKKITDNDIFVDNEGCEVPQKDEKDFLIKDILDKNTIQITKKNITNNSKEEIKEKINDGKDCDVLNKIFIVNENKEFMELENINQKCCLSTLKDLCADKISENSLFMLLGNVIKKEKENKLLICNITDKKNRIFFKQAKKGNKGDNENKINIEMEEDKKDKVLNVIDDNQKDLENNDLIFDDKEDKDGKEIINNEKEEIAENKNKLENFLNNMKVYLYFSKIILNLLLVQKKLLEKILALI